MQKVLKYPCFALVLLIRSFVSLRSCCHRRRDFLKVPILLTLTGWRWLCSENLLRNVMWHCIFRGCRSVRIDLFSNKHCAVLIQHHQVLGRRYSTGTLPPALLSTQVTSIFTQLDIGQHELLGVWNRRCNAAAYKPHEIEVSRVEHVFIVQELNVVMPDPISQLLA